jgi:hypothetical protein
MRKIQDRLEKMAASGDSLPNESHGVAADRSFDAGKLFATDAIGSIDAE